MHARGLVAAALASFWGAAVGAAEAQLIGLVEGNALVRFTSDRPGEVTRVAVTGVAGTLLGVDVRPADGRLYGVSSTSDVYVIDARTGAARAVSTLTIPVDGSVHSGFDWNPQADRLRLVAESGQNLRVHVDLGAVAADGSLSYLAGDDHAGAHPRIAAAAYANNVRAATATRLFDIDHRLDVLALQDPPNDGGLRTIGALGVDFAPRSGFDIATRVDGSDLALAASGGVLYRIDLATGKAQAIGAIGDGKIALIALAIEPAGSPVAVSSHPPGALARSMKWMGPGRLRFDPED